MAGRESLPRCWVLSLSHGRGSVLSLGQGLAQRRVTPAHRHSRPAASSRGAGSSPSGPCYPILGHAQAGDWTTRASQV